MKGRELPNKVNVGTSRTSFHRTCYFYALLGASKEVGLEVNTEKTKYMLLSRNQNAGQNHDIKIANRYFENVAQSKCLGTTEINQSLIHYIKNRFIWNKTCYQSAQNLLFSCPLS
jgi:hypothetical protein